MLAVVLLARRRLRVEVGNGRLNLAELPAELERALAAVRVVAVHASSAVLKIRIMKSSSSPKLDGPSSVLTWHM